jgi:predicted MFS family arabinose efflux permease
MMIYVTAAAWLMTSLTDSSLLIAGVQSASTIPMVLFALIAGAAADLFDRRIIMLVATSSCACLALALFTLVTLKLITPGILIALVVSIGTGMSFHMQCWQASVRELVSREHLASAISLNNVSANVGRCVGPALGVEIIMFAGVDKAFLPVGVTFTLVFLTVLFWRRTHVPTYLPRESVVRAITDGLRFASVTPVVRVILGRAFLTAFCASPLLATPALIALAFDAGPRGLGMLVTSFGVGAILGALLLAKSRASYAADTIVKINTVVLALTLAALSQSASIGMSAAIFVVAGASWTQVLAMLQAALQVSSPHWVFGRIISINSMVFFGGVALGALFWGRMVDQASLSTVHIISALAALSAAIMYCFVPFKETDADDIEPNPFVSDLPNLDLGMQEVPVFITVEYRISSANIDDFLLAIQKMRALRRRDGASGWSLAQDIECPELWLERFQCPSWKDHLRQLSRGLSGDQYLHDELERLSIAPPEWHRRLNRTSTMRSRVRIQS